MVISQMGEEAGQDTSGHRNDTGSAGEVHSLDGGQRPRGLRLTGLLAEISDADD